MQDILTDLNAEGEVLPIEPAREDWLGHKGMVQAAIYIKDLMEKENLIEKAHLHNLERNTQTFGLVLVGHSLGAGTAAILAIIMKQKYPDLECYSYSPPGGLLRYLSYKKIFNIFIEMSHKNLPVSVCPLLNTQSPLSHQL